MGMSIEEIKAKLDKSNIDSDTLIELTRYLERYQKIEQIIIDTAPTVEAIPKAEYENRLKADMVAMLTEILLKIDEESWGKQLEGLEKAVDMVDVNMIIQRKINELKAKSEDKE